MPHGATSFKPTANPRVRAVLLLGPTGSGKTPLGDMMQLRGFRGSACAHFDFGAQLRGLVERGQPSELVTAAELAFLADVLRTNALLEDNRLNLACRILHGFLRQQAVRPGTIVVLNGLPRHLGQANALAELVEVVCVVGLSCTADVAGQRIASNAGGDRDERTDDDPTAIERKLRLFQERTAPLAAHYGQQGAEIVTIEVSAGMTAQAMWAQFAH